MKIFLHLVFLLSFYVVCSCMPHEEHSKITVIEHPESSVEYYTELLEIQNKVNYYSQFSLFEIRLLSHGFVKISDIDSSILIDLRYASSRNIWNQALYTNFSYAFVHKDVHSFIMLDTCS